MACLYMSLLRMGDLEASRDAARMDTDEAHSWGGKALEAAAANRADGTVPYAPASPAQGPPILPWLFTLWKAERPEFWWVAG